MADPTWLQDIFCELGPVEVKRMFGGQGVFHQGLMVALVADEQLYLKADAQTQAQFESIGMQPFRYQKGDKIVSMSYFEAPESLYDDPEQAAHWCQLAYQAARRSRKGA